MQFFRGNLYDRFDFYGLLRATSSPRNDNSLSFGLPRFDFKPNLAMAGIFYDSGNPPVSK